MMWPALPDGSRNWRTAKGSSFSLVLKHNGQLITFWISRLLMWRKKLALWLMWVRSDTTHLLMNTLPLDVFNKGLLSENGAGFLLWLMNTEMKGDRIKCTSLYWNVVSLNRSSILHWKTVGSHYTIWKHEFVTLYSYM